MDDIEFENMETHDSQADAKNTEELAEPIDEIHMQVNPGFGQTQTTTTRKGSVLTFDFKWPYSTQFGIDMVEEIRAEEGVIKTLLIMRMIMRWVF